MDKKTMKKAGTFQLNKVEAIHNWYAYMEAYSSCLVNDELDLLKSEKIETIYDPFGGTGTTPLVASQRNIISYYSETNPFMLNVIDAKINCVKKLIDNQIKSKYLIKFKEHIEKSAFNKSKKKITWNGFEKFFDNQNLIDILKIKEEIQKVEEENSKKILMIALSSITVPASKMMRHGDLRYATEKEKPIPIDVKEAFLTKLNTIINDIDKFGDTVKCHASLLNPDSRDITAENIIDCVITSPPYLNGTNYIRNTKLELKLNDYLDSEDDMPRLHSKGIIAGINNVSKRQGEIQILDIIKPLIEKLEPVVYDSRITKMVAGYFKDMNQVIEKLSICIKNNGIFVMDIGDSQFAGVHVPTHEILSQICEMHGFEKYDETILRERRSKNNMILSQRILRFRLNKNKNNVEISNTENKCIDFKSKAEQFIKKMPYKKEPYSGRNWGHPWHSLCSYHGKLKPAIAHFLIKEFTHPNDIILDPLCGVGTIPFEACLQGRIGIGNDLSELAYVVTKAKLERPNINDVNQIIEDLENYITENKNSKKMDDLIELNSQFGYNGQLKAYFHPDTFREIICTREYFIDNINNLSAPDAMVFSAFLHVLHGNRPYALSRTSHPLTPYAPKGEFVYKNVMEHIKDKVSASYKKRGDLEGFKNGKASFGDYNDINNLNNKVDFIISSPPFADSIKFYMQNWMRLWLCGWNTEQFKNADNLFLDTKQKNNFKIYDSFFKMCSNVLKEKGKIILHLGKTDKIDMAEELMKYATPYFNEIFRGTENVSDIEKHGIKDKGTTIAHQFLFLEKK